jgi:hypothetical protein
MAFSIGVGLGGFLIAGYLFKRYVWWSQVEESKEIIKEII